MTVLRLPDNGPTSRASGRNAVGDLTVCAVQADDVFLDTLDPATDLGRMLRAWRMWIHDEPIDIYQPEENQ